MIPSDQFGNGLGYDHDLVELARVAAQMEGEANRWAWRAGAAALATFLVVTIALGAALGGG